VISAPALTCTARTLIAVRSTSFVSRLVLGHGRAPSGCVGYRPGPGRGGDRALGRTGGTATDPVRHRADVDPRPESVDNQYVATHRRKRAALVAMLGCLGLIATAGDAAARKPVIVSLSVTPSVLPSGGGGFTIFGRVRRSGSCTIFYYDGRLTKRTVNCSSGRFSYRQHAPANTTTQPASWSVWVEAHSGRQNAQSGETLLEVLPSVPTPPPVKGLDACIAGPHCDYGYSYESFQTWGNVALNRLATAPSRRPRTGSRSFS
jgi:hypothetical protein